MPSFSPNAKQQFLNSAGGPLVGGKVFTYEAGTTLPQVTYTSSDGGTPNTNPVILDTNGEASIWLGENAYKFVVKNSGDVLVYTVDNLTSSASQIAELSAPNGSSFVGYLPAGIGAVATNVQEKLREIVSVEDFGAVGDGSTDDTLAIQTAINYVQEISSGQIELHFDAKTYRIAGTLNISGMVRLIGQGAVDFSNARPLTIPGKGTWLIHASTTGPLIQVSGNLNKGAGLFDIAIFEEGHTTPSAGWAPAVRDWVIRVENTQGTLLLNRVHFHGVYQGVLTDYAARLQYENITGQFFYRGFSFDRVYDIGKFDGLHAWTYWSEADSVLQWQQANCVEITLYRVDGLWMDRIFTFAVQTSIFVDESAYGTSKVIIINGLYSDFSNRAIVVDSAQPVHLQVSNMFHLGQAWPPASPANALPGSCSIDIASGSNHLVQVSNLYDTLAESHAVRVAGTNNTLWIGSGIFTQYSRDTVCGAITVAATNTVRFGSVPLLSPYAGGLSTLFNGTPGGTAFEQTRQVTVSEAVNYPVTYGNATGQLVAYTVEGEAAAGVSVIAKTTGVVNIAASTNLLGFYGAASTARQTGVAVTAAGIHAALVNLGLIAA
jgi:hypothetical protein